MALPFKKRKMNSGLASQVATLKKKVSRITPDRQTYQNDGIITGTTTGFREAVIDITAGILPHVEGDFIIEDVQFRVLTENISVVSEMRTDLCVAKGVPSFTTTGAGTVSEFLLPKLIKSYKSISSDQDATENRIMEGGAKTGLVVKNEDSTVMGNRHYLVVRYRQATATTPNIRWAVQVNFREK